MKVGFDAMSESSAKEDILLRIEEEAMACSCDEFLACIFIMMADDSRYKPLKTQLENDFLLGKLHYPQTVVAAKSLLSDYKMDTKLSAYIKRKDDDASVAFAKQPSYEDYKKNVQCHGCGGKGNFLKECKKTPTKKKEEIFAMVKSGTFTKTPKCIVNTSVEDTNVEPTENPRKPE